MKFVHRTVFRGVATWLEEESLKPVLSAGIDRAIFRDDFALCKVQFDARINDSGWPKEIDLQWNATEQAYEAHAFPFAAKLRIKKLPNLKVLEGHWHLLHSRPKSESAAPSDDFHTFSVNEVWVDTTVTYRLVFDMHEYEFESAEIDESQEHSHTQPQQPLEWRSHIRTNLAPGEGQKTFSTPEF